MMIKYLHYNVPTYHNLEGSNVLKSYIIVKLTIPGYALKLIKLN